MAEKSTTTTAACRCDMQHDSRWCCQHDELRSVCSVPRWPLTPHLSGGMTADDFMGGVNR